MALALAKMGVPRLVVWDDDDVSEHNIPMSAYRVKDFMRPKVEALKDLVKEGSGLTIEVRKEKYLGQEPLSGDVVACVDSMESRQLIWRAARMNPDVGLLVDTRTAGKLLWVFAVCPTDPDDIDRYGRHTSYGTREAEPHMCGKHGFMPMSYLAAAWAAEALTSWWMSGTKTLHRTTLVADATEEEQ